MAQKISLDKNGDYVVQTETGRLIIPATERNNRYSSIVTEYIRSGNDVSPYVPERLSSRQFKMQLYKSGLLEQVQKWVRDQDASIGIAFEESTEFYRSDPFMNDGFEQMGFNPDEIDLFFIAAGNI
ncbi:hypothetical protein [Brucella tritici]|nr:hypothetical protein [Brucella tritici]